MQNNAKQEQIFRIIFPSEGTVTNPAFWLVVSAGKILLYLPTGHGNAFVRFCPCVYKNSNSFLYAKKKKISYLPA